MLVCFFSNIIFKKYEENKQEKALHINLNDNLHLDPVIYIQITPLFFSYLFYSIYFKISAEEEKTQTKSFFFLPSNKPNPAQFP